MIYPLSGVFIDRGGLYKKAAGGPQLSNNQQYNGVRGSNTATTPTNSSQQPPTLSAHRTAQSYQSQNQPVVNNSQGQQTNGFWDTAKGFGKWYAKGVLGNLWSLQNGGFEFLVPGGNPYTKATGLEDQQQ